MALPSFSQIIADIENDISTTEADVWGWIVQIKAGLVVVEADLTSGLKWVASVAPGWVTALQGVVALAGTIPGLNIPAAAIEATTAAAVALTAVAAAENAGKSNAATLVDAYNAVVSAKAAHVTIQQVVTAAPTPAKA